MSGEAVLANKFKGKALIVYHHFGDFLWALAPGSPAPNSGFTKQVVRSLDPPEQQDDSAQEDSSRDVSPPIESGIHDCANIFKASIFFLSPSMLTVLQKERP